MQVGSLVETVYDFGTNGLPKLRDVLTVDGVYEPEHKELIKAGIVLLTFEEFPDLHALCDKQIDGTPNFLELRLPDDIEELLSEPVGIELETVDLETY